MMDGLADAAWQGRDDRLTAEFLMLDFERKVTSILTATGLPIVLFNSPLSAEEAARRDGLGPIFALEAGLVWRDAADEDLGIAIEEDPNALFGFSLARPPSTPLILVLESLAVALDKLATPFVGPDKKVSRALVMDAAATRWFTAETERRRVAAAALQAPENKADNATVVGAAGN